MDDAIDTRPTVAEELKAQGIVSWAWAIVPLLLAWWLGAPWWALVLWIFGALLAIDIRADLSASSVNRLRFVRALEGQLQEVRAEVAENADLVKMLREELSDLDVPRHAAPGRMREAWED